MTSMKAARWHVWGAIRRAVAARSGFATSLHRAALNAQLCRDPEGQAFAELAARLPAEDRRELWRRIDFHERGRAS